MPTPQELALEQFQAKRRTQGTTPVTSPSGNPANMYNTSNPSQTLLQTLDANTAASNASKANFNSSINLYGGNIQSVPTGGSINTPTNKNVPTVPATPVSTSSSANNTPDNLGKPLDTNGNVTGIKSVDDFAANLDNSPGILTFDELPKELQDQYNKDPYARSQFDLYSKKGLQDQKNYLREGLKTFKDFQTRDKYATDQAKLKTEADKIQQGAIARQQKTGLTNGIQNANYSQTSSGVSTAGKNATEQRINEMVQTIDNTASLADLGNQAYAMSVKENARLLNQSYQKAIGETYFNKLKDISAQIDSGEIKDEDQLYKIFQEASDAMLREVPELSNAAIQQMGVLTDSFMNTQKELRSNANTYMQNANIYNPEMSQVQGFAVDGNGQQILGANGQPIEIPKESPIKPFFDEKSGQFVTFTTDELTGMIIPHATKVAGYTPTPTAQPQVWGKFDDTHVINQATGEIKAVGSTSSANSSPIPIDSSTIDQALTECRANGQCGEGVNDYLQKLGLPRIFGDSYEQKVSQINSYSPQVGSVAIWNPSATSGKAYGHVAVVTKINGDGTVQVHDWNWDNKGNQKTHDVDMKEITGTGGGYYVPTQTQSQTGPSATVESILNGALNIKDLPTGDREKIGNEVNRYLNETTKNIADQDEVAIRRSAVYTKGMSDTTQQKINKINTVKQQLGDVTALLNEESTGPIIGILKSNNPYDTKAQQIKTAIQALVPNLARGVFGEVGVLTDNDIANYSKTVPNLKSTAELNDAILGMINKTLGKTFTDTVATAAKNRENVSMYLDDYKANLPDSSSANTSSQSSNQNNSNPYGI